MISLIQIYSYLVLVLAVVAADQEVCDKTKCPGPLDYYRQLDCTPVYEKEGDCCAIKYNCDEKSTKKCYVNGKEYNVSEKLRKQDANLCDIKCVCKEGKNGVASFACRNVVCYNTPADDCYWRNSVERCCGGEEVCVPFPENRYECFINGTAHKEGEIFTVKNEPDMLCVCLPGYAGQNIEPFCIKQKRSPCNPFFRPDAASVHDKCAPVYQNGDAPQTNCHSETRCQTDDDTVIHHHDNVKSGGRPNEENMCEYGNLTMHIGDELNQVRYSRVCIKCICEVPPTPTCLRLPSNMCDLINQSPSYR